MAEKEEATAPKSKSWLKAILGTMGGLLSGAVMMYVTPLVNNVVKPEKPVANFEVHDDGLKVQFHNLSNFGEGRWDFGDGSPLLPTQPDQTVEHSYPRPGDYTVKLSLHNAFGDENERSVPVHVEAATAAAPVPPKILSLTAIPISPGSFAPATYKLVGKVDNAQIALLDLGDDRPYEIITDNANSFEKIVTFPKPRHYEVRLSAINGTLSESKTATVAVVKAPENSLTAMLTVTDEAMCQEKKAHTATFNAAFPVGSRESTCSIQSEVRARSGHSLVDLTCKTANGQEVHLGAQTSMSLDPQMFGLSGVRNLRLQMSDDKQSVSLTGELVADRKNKTAPLPSLMIPVTLTVQKKMPTTQTIHVTTMLNIPVNGAFTSGTLVLPPVPKDWCDCRRKLQLAILNASDVKIYEDTQLQRSALLTVGNRKLILTTSQTNDQVRLDLLDAPTGVSMTTH